MPDLSTLLAGYLLGFITAPAVLVGQAVWLWLWEHRR